MTQSPGMFGVTPCIRLLYKTLCSQAWSGTRTGWLIRWPSSRAHYKRTHYSANTFKLHSHTDTCTSSVAIHQGNLRLHVCQIGWKSARKFSKYTSQNKRLHFFPDKVCLVCKKAVRMDIIVNLAGPQLRDSMLQSWTVNCGAKAYDTSESLLPKVPFESKLSDVS